MTKMNYIWIIFSHSFSCVFLFSMVSKQRGVKLCLFLVPPGLTWIHNSFSSVSGNFSGYKEFCPLSTVLKLLMLSAYANVLR